VSLLGRVAAGSYGQTIRVTLTESDGTALDISGATTTEILIRDDTDDTVTTLTASFATDGTDGIIEATVTSGTLDSQGRHHVQAHIASAVSEYWSELGEIVTFQVLA
jgi:hypothetical protein